MAARENQGLQIFLIVFVLLTLLLAVTTFVFVRKSNTETARADAAEATGAKDRQDRDKLREERGQLLQYIGLTATEELKAATEAWDKDMQSAQAFGVANLPPDQKTYKKLLDGFKAAVRAKDAQLAKQDLDFRDSKTTYEKKTSEYVDQIKSLTDQVNAVVADYLKERERITEQVNSLTAGQKELAKQSSDKDKATEALKAQLDSKIGALEKERDKIKTQLTIKADDYNKVSGTFAINANPDGQIVLVNEREKIAYINLGSADGLRKRITFSVYDPGTTDVSAIVTKDADGNPIRNPNQMVSETQKKGTIEVINVTGPHMAEARITSDSTKNPLVQGDLVFTPIWRPGKQDHFAFVGLMDIDGDGRADSEKIHELVRTHGGIIDAEIDDKGNLVGEVTPLTRYVVKGASDAKASQGAGTKKLYEDATVLGVEAVDLAKFLDMMGYTPPLDENKIVRGRTPTAPNPGEPTSNFRPRVPPERGSKGGGY
jgi:hypothetical protein